MTDPQNTIAEDPQAPVAENPQAPVAEDPPAELESHRRWVSDHKLAVWTVVIAAVVGGPVPIYLAATDDEPPQGVCNIWGDNNTQHCPVSSVPAVKVEEDAAGKWALRIRDFMPGSTVTIAITGPNGEAFDLGRYEQRVVESDGTADTDRKHYFWEHVAGEPVGTYTVTVTGTDRQGRPADTSNTFDVGGQA
jgi:hypothetical protein